MNNTLKRYTFIIGILLVLITLLLSGCSGVNVPARTPAADPSATPETQSPIVTSTVENHMLDWLRPENSINLSSEEIDRSTIPGTLVLAIDYVPYLYEIKTDKLDSKQIENTQMVSDIYVTKTKLAYTYYDTINTHNDYLLIRDLTNNGIQVFPIDYDKWGDITYWANPDSLVLVDYRDLQRPLIIYNTQTHQYRTIPIDYPEIGSLDLWLWRMWPALGVISPDLNKLIYLGVDKLIIQDLTKNEKLFEIDNIGYIEVSPPIWSPDGKMIAVIKNYSRDQYEIMIDNLYVATINGDINNLTNLNIGCGFNIIQIMSYQWSPTGSKIAFWINTMTERKQKFHGYQLAIADITTGQIDLYNISSYINYPTEPIWSEDEAFLAISVNKTDDDYNSYILSLEDNKTYPLPGNAIPYGWVTIP